MAKRKTTRDPGPTTKGKFCVDCDRCGQQNLVLHSSVAEGTNVTCGSCGDELFVDDDAAKDASDTARANSEDGLIDACENPVEPPDAADLGEL